MNYLCAFKALDAASEPSWFQVTPPYDKYSAGASLRDDSGKPVPGALIVFDRESTDRVIEAEDKRTGTTKFGLISIPANGSGYIYDDTATNTKVLQKVAIENALGDDCVGLTGSDQPMDLQNRDGVVELGKYLKGGADEDGAEYGYGKNINTANFEDKCLPKNEDEDVVTGTATTAARSDHKHYSSDIYYEDKNEKDVSVFSSIDAFLSYLENLKLTDVGETLPENETPDDKRLVTFNDLIKANTATQGADGIGTDKVSEQEPPTSMTDTFTSEGVEIFDLPGYIIKEAALKSQGLYQGSWNRATNATAKAGDSAAASRRTPSPRARSQRCARRDAAAFRPASSASFLISAAHLADISSTKASTSAMNLRYASVARS